MDIAKEAQKGDEVLELEGLTVFLERQAKGMLTNTSIDFEEGRGFTLTGMKQSTCSC